MKPAFTLISYALRTASLVSPRLAGRLTFKLFAYPGPRAKVRSNEQSIHAQAQTPTIVMAGQQVAVYRWGDGAKPVLMVHGWGSRGSRYAAFVPELLAHGFSPITFDAPGHGESSGWSTHILEYAAIIHRLHDQYGPFEAIIGHSYGALAAFHALRTGATASRLVTIGSPCELSYLPNRHASQLGLGSRVQADLRQRMEGFFAPEPDIWHRFSATYQPSALPMPMLVIHDRDDAVIDPAQAGQIVAAYAPRAHMLATRGLGHHRILSSPTIIQQITDFATSMPQPPQRPEAK